MKSEVIRILVSGASASWGMNLTDTQLSQFDTFAQMIVEWNRDRLNLTRLTSPQQIAVLHFLDSLSLLHAATFPIGSVCLDVGTGAGLPGIALKIARPDLIVTLLDSTRKKLAFCDSVIQQLGLDGITTLHARAEECATDRSVEGKFDIVVARAVAPLDRLIPWCVPFVGTSGRFFAMKGPGIAEEIIEGRKAARKLGFKILASHEIALPEMEVPTLRTIVEIGR